MLDTSTDPDADPVPDPSLSHKSVERTEIMVANFGTDPLPDPHPLEVRIQGSGLHLDPYQIVTDPEHCFIHHCLICHPSDSTMSENAGIEPRTVATLAINTQLDLIHGKLTEHSFTIGNGTVTKTAIIPMAR